MTKKVFSIAVFPGDGIGKEITKQALKVLNFLNEKINVELRLNEGTVGGTAYDIHGTPLPPESLDLALKSDAVLLGAVGGPKWESLDYALRPERALLGLRKKLRLFANLRPVAAFEELLHTSTLKA